MPPMARSILKWTLYLAALLALGPAVATLTGALRDPTGGHAATLLSSTSLGAGLLAGFVALAAAAVIGVAGSKNINVGTGCTLAGIVLAWAGWRLGSLEDLARLPNSSVPLLTIAIENGLVTLAAAAIAFLCVKTGSGIWSASEGNALASKPERDDLPNLPTLATGALGAIVASTLAVYLMANNGFKGQTLAAATLGGVASAIFAQLAVAGKRSLITPVIPSIAVALVALVGPIVALAMHGSKIDALVYAGKVLPLARPVSLEWAAGALMGVPLGLSWTASSVDPRAAERQIAGA